MVQRSQLLDGSRVEEAKSRHLKSTCISSQRLWDVYQLLVGQEGDEAGLTGVVLHCRVFIERWSWYCLQAGHTVPLLLLFLHPHLETNFLDFTLLPVLTFLAELAFSYAHHIMSHPSMCSIISLIISLRTRFLIPSPRRGGWLIGL